MKKTILNKIFKAYMMAFVVFILSFIVMKLNYNNDDIYYICNTLNKYIVIVGFAAGVLISFYVIVRTIFNKN